MSKNWNPNENKGLVPMVSSRARKNVNRWTTIHYVIERVVIIDHYYCLQVLRYNKIPIVVWQRALSTRILLGDHVAAPETRAEIVVSTPLFNSTIINLLRPRLVGALGATTNFRNQEQRHIVLDSPVPRRRVICERLARV